MSLFRMHKVLIQSSLPTIPRRLFSTTNKVQQTIRNGSFRRRTLNSRQENLVYPNYNTSTIIQAHHPIATSILNEPTIIVERQIEMMNLFLGFEQANRYHILDVNGNRLGRIEERDFSIGKIIMRQMTRLHRPFTVDVFDNYDNLILTINRPFSFINSHIKVMLPNQSLPDTNQHLDENLIVGETIQNWHLWRRRYELFTKPKLSNTTNAPQDDFAYKQFGNIDSPFLSFEFPVYNNNNQIIAGVDRNWVGLGRELFTDTGVYIVRFDSTQSFENIYPPEMLSSKPMNLDEKAVLLANAISIDFDYFSRHSRGNGLFVYDSE